MRAVLPQIERRMVVDRDTHCGEFERHRFCTRSRGFDRARRSKLEQPIKCLPAGIGGPMRGAQTGDAATLLID